MIDDGAARIVPLGDSALLVEFGSVISVELNERALSLSEYLENQPFEGFVESVPAYASVAVYFDPVRVRRTRPGAGTAFEIVRQKIARVVDQPGALARNERELTIDCRFGGADGPDLGTVAEGAGVSESEVLDVFLGRTYRVYMLGFLPGFSYMGEVDPRIATPRRDTPRARVPKGSVGIAGSQTGIYSLDSPGGWQIIGRTEMPMFLADEEPPSFLRPGDRVRFRAV